MSNECWMSTGRKSSAMWRTHTMLSAAMLPKEQVHVVWNLRSSAEGEQGGPGLQVSPMEADLPAGGSQSFRVEVSPTKRNYYFAEEAEAFVSPANQMTFRCVTFIDTLLSNSERQKYLLRQHVTPETHAVKYRSTRSSIPPQ